MSQLDYSAIPYKTPLHKRIIASMPIQASWVDAESGETISVDGLTENVGETSTLVSKPLAALTILENLKKWKGTALSAAQRWVTRHWQLNYEEEWVN
jgi:hypothetical protein